MTEETEKQDHLAKAWSEVVTARQYANRAVHLLTEASAGKDQPELLASAVGAVTIAKRNVELASSYLWALVSAADRADAPRPPVFAVLEMPTMSGMELQGFIARWQQQVRDWGSVVVVERGSRLTLAEIQLRGLTSEAREAIAHEVASEARKGASDGPHAT